MNHHLGNMFAVGVWLMAICGVIYIGYTCVLIWWIGHELGFW